MIWLLLFTVLAWMGALGSWLEVRIGRYMFRRTGSIGHPSSWRYYYVANSLLGLLWIFKILRKPWADRDIRRTLDGVLVVVHGWPDKWYLDGKLVTTPIEHLHSSVVFRLRRNGIGIVTLERQFRFMAERKLRGGFKVEPKHPATIRDLADAEQIVAWGKRYGVRVSFYILAGNDFLRTNVPGVAHNTRQSALLHAAGIPGEVIR